ncbi:MAG: peptidylprolyl isomerase [Spirochaetia bacterium]
MTLRKLTASIIFGVFIACIGFADVIDVPIAMINFHSSEVITQGQLREKYELIESQLGGRANPTNREELLDLMIGEVLINQAAQELGITVSQAEIDQRIQATRQSLGVQVTDEQFRMLVQQQTGSTWEEFVDQIRQRVMQEKYVTQVKRELFENIDPPSESEIQEVFEENALQFVNPPMVRFSHIFIDTRNLGDEDRNQARERAEEIYRDLQNGAANFEELVREYSDDTSSRYSGGDFGYLVRNDERAVALLGREFVSQPFSMEEGEIEGVLESNIGFHIIKITDKRDRRFLELDDQVSPNADITVRQQIVNYIMNSQQQQIFQQAVNEVLEELRAQADITIYEQNLNW